MFLLDQGLTMTSMTMSRALVWQCSMSKEFHGVVCDVLNRRFVTVLSV